MGSNAATQPLLPGPPKDAPKRRALRHCKSAPLADSLPIDAIGIVPGPPPPRGAAAALFGKIHPSLCRVILLLSLYLALATACFYAARDDLEGRKTGGLLDALYFCIVTMTTVGYGDLVPRSATAKLLACAFVFSGMALGCLILTKAADYLLEKHEILLVTALNASKKLARDELLKEAEANRKWYKCVAAFALLAGLVIVGTVFLCAVEGMSVVDAFYCVCSTVTTLGYGDKSFSTEAGRVFAVFWILISTVCLAQFFLYVAELNTENRQRKLVKWVLTRKVTNVDLEAADLDDDGDVEVAEFVLYKLKEMGKITQEDISVIMEEFENLDVDQSGTLSTSDIVFAQSNQTDQR